MFDLIETAEKILELVDTHCEPSICKVKNCEKCAEIKRLRDKIGKEETRTKRTRYIYSAWKDGKLVNRYIDLSEVISLIGCSKSGIYYMFENGNKNNGYTVTRELRELGELV